MNIIPFSFESHQVRVIANENGEPLFVGKDLCDALGYADATTAIRSHCRGVQILHPIADSLGRMQKTRVLAEPDMMRLVVNSTLPSAQSFEALVFETILPSIRKTGAYIAGLDSIDHLPPALARQVGGIVKAVVQKAVNDALAEALPQAVNAYVAMKQISTRRGLTAGQVMSDHGLTKIRNGDKVLSRMLCERKCLIDGAGRAEMGGSTAKLFDPDKVRAQIKLCYLREQYEAYVKERKGQLSLFKVVGKSGD